MRLLTFLILLCSSTAIYATSEIISSNNVNVRDKPFSNTVIDKVPFNTEIVIESIDKDYIVFNGYVGKWCKIKYNGKSGYVLSCFIASDKIIEQPFHIFVEELFQSVKREDYSEQYFNYPLQYKYSGAVDPNSSDRLYKDHFIDKSIINQNYFSFAISKSKKEVRYRSENGQIIINYGWYGYSVSYNFKIVNDNWRMVLISISNY